MITEFLYGTAAFPAYRIENEHATAVISRYGAHILSFAPRKTGELLMVSGKSEWADGAPIRGGVPVCWPWFGGAGNPAHGIARRQLWDLVELRSEEDGSDTVVLELHTPEPDLTVRMSANFGASMTMRLTTRNTGDQPWQLSQALHTYFAASAIADVEVSGLENAAYVDTVGGVRNEMPATGKTIRFAEETDRYYHSDAAVILTDSGNGRKLRISKEGSRETVVWNPWIAKAQRMPDFGDEEYLQMLCIEAANIPGILLEPGAEHTLMQRIEVLA